MNKAKRRIISGAVLFGCALLTICASSKIAEKAEKGAVPAAIIDMDGSTPTIILDAGHGESN